MPRFAFFPRRHRHSHSCFRHCFASLDFESRQSPRMFHRHVICGQTFHNKTNSGRCRRGGGAKSGLVWQLKRHSAAAVSSAKLHGMSARHYTSTRVTFTGVA
ncbi:hypothetical protein CEXT_323241 [Caerostris extrusa]|uniref:Uncharacterized protein n=1 Tax=Caerostris extrusa TaxID=172846 RepID=A0AAV4N1M2_CAEEX|nr:hypothetical protein CEXT_323241 [Caerostris extrusa]